MASASKKNQENDVKVQSPPSDGISSLALNGDISTRPNILVATSWDKTVNGVSKVLMKVVSNTVSLFPLHR